eukprot:gene33134-biopygen26268
MVEGVALDGAVVDSVLGKRLGVEVGFIVDGAAVGTMVGNAELGLEVADTDGALEVGPPVVMDDGSLEGRLLDVGVTVDGDKEGSADVGRRVGGVDRGAVGVEVGITDMVVVGTLTGANVGLADFITLGTMVGELLGLEVGNGDGS